MLATETEAAILDRVFRSDRGDLSPEVAGQLLKLDFSDSDHARMEELSIKAQDGALSVGEREELEGYINVSHLIALFQSKARKSLKNNNSAA
jgi:hypothetical protein